jgi:tellurite resistance protein
MNINRLNYENYFLLYADGELSAAERQAVESFATENKDLADELDMLLQTKLPAEADDTFDNKSILFRTASLHINSINCEEKFLLFVDDELTEQEKNETIDFVSNHPQYQTAFDAILETKLPTETISFPNKDSLFRKEERKPVIVMQWWKLAVAAALIGILVMAGIFFPANRNASELAKAKINTRTIPKTFKSKEQKIDIKPITIEQPILAKKNNTTNSHTDFNPELKNKTAQQQVSEKLIAKTEVPNQKMEQETIAMNADNSIPTNNNHTIGSESSSHANEISAVNNRIQGSAEPSYAKPAVYKELDTDDDRKSLYLGSVEINKDKLRGFIRKASSLFKGKNKTEEEKTEISNSHTLE